MTRSSDLMSVPAGLSPDAVTALSERSLSRDSAASFQALLAALGQVVASAREPVAQAESAALSLRQRDTVRAVRNALDALGVALAAGVSTEGRCLATPRTPAEMVRAVLRPVPGWRHRAKTPLPPTWVAAAGMAVEGLGGAATHAETLALAQPAASSARILGERVAASLREGRDALLADVARMMD